MVKVVTESKIGLNWLGKIITHKDVGKGIVVGYSSVSGEPFAYFYSGEFAYRICCFAHEGVVSVEKTHVDQGREVEAWLGK